MKSIPRWTGATLCAAAALLLLFTLAGARQTDPNQHCVQNVARVVEAVLLYAQDYDENLPMFQHAREARSAIQPYVGSADVFSCPITRQLYRFNTNLAGRTFASLPDFGTVEVMWDAAPHPDGKVSVGYLDGYVLQNGHDAGDTYLDCAGNVHRQAIGVAEYAQDYDETLPLFHSQRQFRSEIYVYDRDFRSLSCPVTGALYQANTAISGKLLSAFPNPNTTWVVRDSVPHPNGSVTIGYLDGHTSPPYPGTPPTKQKCLSNVKSVTLEGWPKSGFSGRVGYYERA